MRAGDSENIPKMKKCKVLSRKGCKVVGTYKTLEREKEHRSGKGGVDRAQRGHCNPSSTRHAHSWLCRLRMRRGRCSLEGGGIPM